MKKIKLKKENKDVVDGWMGTYGDMILLEGISMLPNKPHPYTVQDHLNRYLDSSNHFDIADK